MNKRVSAHDAVQLIVSNLSDRRLPFAVELTTNVQVFPILHEYSLNGEISPMMASILPTPSLSSSQVHSTSRSSTLLQSNAVTLTVTKTIPCSSYFLQTAGAIPTMQPYFTESSSSGTSGPCAHTLGTGGTVGVAVGAFIAGIFTTILMIVLCVACCNWCNQQSMKSAGWQPVSRSTDSEMDHFH